MPSDCVFCRIASGEVPAELVYRDEHVTAFRDIRPQARTHVLVIPNRHIPSLADATPEDVELLGRLTWVAAEIARQEGIESSGYRVLTNVGRNAGQTVFHLHLHVLGGNRLTMELG